MVATMPEQAPPRFVTFARFERVDPAGNVARFYVVEHRRTLWSEPAVVVTWGRIGGTGRSLATICQDQAEAERVADREAGRRLERGYALTARI